MASLPPYVTVLLSGRSEEFDPEVINTPMERGLAKQRLGNSRVVIKAPASLLFTSREDTISFDVWYFDTIKRIGWFDWFDARHQIIRSVRFEGGAIGRLTPIAGRYECSSRTATLEYLR